MSQVQTIHAKLLKIVDAIQNAETKQKVTAMIEDPRLMNLLMSCPASIQESTGGAYVGGLLDYAILTTSYLKKMASPELGLNIPVDDIILAGLFHHLGKIGWPAQSVYTELDSDWHKKKGIHYEMNRGYYGYNFNTISLWYLGEYGIKVSPEAFEAISAMSNKPADEFNYNSLTILLLAASRLAWKKLTAETK